MEDESMGLVDDAAKRLMPPGVEPTLAWRLAVSISIGSLIIGFCWALGFLSWLGPGFARADGLDAVNKRIDVVQGQIADVKAELLAKEIDAVSTALCMEAYEPKLLDYRNDLQGQYKALTGSYHESPPCEILLKLKH